LEKSNGLYFHHNQIDQLNKEKCELISSLNCLKKKIEEIEMRQNEAIKDVSILFFFL
jgi:hypothetical protein